MTLELPFIPLPLWQAPHAYRNTWHEMTFLPFIYWEGKWYLWNLASYADVKEGYFIETSACVFILHKLFYRYNLETCFFISFRGYNPLTNCIFKKKNIPERLASQQCPYLISFTVNFSTKLPLQSLSYLLGPALSFQIVFLLIHFLLSRLWTLKMSTIPPKIQPWVLMKYK